VLSLAPLVFSLGMSAMDVQSAPYVDRVVAIVGEHVILLSEVRARAAMVARAQKIDLSQMTDSVLREVTERLVEEQLEQTEADKLKLTVSPQEVEATIDQLAQANKTTVAKFIESAKGQGVSEPELRDALRRQLMEAALLRTKANQIQRIDEKDLRARYDELKKTVKDPKDLRSFDDLKPELWNQLMQERVAQLREDWLAQLRGRTFVEVRIGSGS